MLFFAPLIPKFYILLTYYLVLLTPSPMDHVPKTKIKNT